MGVGAGGTVHAVASARLVGDCNIVGAERLIVAALEQVLEALIVLWSAAVDVDVAGHVVSLTRPLVAQHALLYDRLACLFEHGLHFVAHVLVGHLDSTKRADRHHLGHLVRLVDIPLADTAPGATLDISANMSAPPQDGKFEIIYQLTNAAGDAMPIDQGDSLWALITVGKVIVYPPATPTAGTTGPGLSTASCVSQGNADFLNQTVSLINAARAANGLPALTVNDKLSTAAQSHSEDMACNSFLNHTGWNGSTPESRIASAGYTASVAKENIYAQPPQYGGNPQAAVDWWMSDPIHRAAILDATVKEIGVGYAAYSRSELGGYFTVDFAAP